MKITKSSLIIIVKLFYRREIKIWFNKSIINGIRIDLLKRIIIWDFRKFEWLFVLLVTNLWKLLLLQLFIIFFIDITDIPIS